MIGIKGKDYLDFIWDMAIARGCNCNKNKYYEQDVLGEMRCDLCKTVIVSQSEINEMEKNHLLPTPNISNKKLTHWFDNQA